MMGYLPSQVQLDAFSYVKPRFFTGIRSLMKKEWGTFNQKVRIMELFIEGNGR